MHSKGRERVRNRDGETGCEIEAEDECKIETERQDAR